MLVVLVVLVFVHFGGAGCRVPGAGCTLVVWLIVMMLVVLCGAGRGVGCGACSSV